MQFSVSQFPMGAHLLGSWSKALASSSTPIFCPHSGVLNSTLGLGSGHHPNHRTSLTALPASALLGTGQGTLTSSSECFPCMPKPWFKNTPITEPYPRLPVTCRIRPCPSPDLRSSSLDPTGPHSSRLAFTVATPSLLTSCSTPRGLAQEFCPRLGWPQ